MKKRRGFSARSWVEDKLAAMAGALALPEVKPTPEPEKPEPRYKLAKEYEPKEEIAPEQPVGPTVQAPAGVPQWEWDEARRNVLAGSAPSMIAVGSDIPSDMTMRLNGLTPIAISRKG